MSTDTNKAIARREVEAVESQGNLAMADEVLAEGYRLHFPGFPTLDREGHKQMIAAFHAAFPDMRITLEAQTAEGEHVANHLVLEGTHQGPFQGIPATGKRVTVRGMNLMRLEGGRIAELWGYLDTLGLVQQLGAIPAPEPAGL
jgi:steroid delta-isomerase-like uncharacterized protein